MREALGWMDLQIALRVRVKQASNRGAKKGSNLPSWEPCCFGSNSSAAVSLCCYHGGMKHLAIPVLFALTLGGCAETKMIAVVNPATGQFARCEMATDAAGKSYSSAVLRASSARACPNDLAAAGWIEVR